MSLLMSLYPRILVIWIIVSVGRRLLRRPSAKSGKSKALIHRQRQMTRTKLLSGKESCVQEVSRNTETRSNNPSFPLLKSDMTSGQYILMILGNNGNGNPFAYQRIVNIIAGTQTTLTVSIPLVKEIRKTLT